VHYPNPRAYTAPEVANGFAAREPSDVFWLGATMYAALKGSPPFGTGDAVEVLARARNSEITVPDGPPAPLMTEMLDRRPQRRPTAEEVRQRLVTGHLHPHQRPGVSHWSARAWPSSASRPRRWP
jgi:eukaryotic-like serine/threonine-protein kinase